MLLILYYVLGVITGIFLMKDAYENEYPNFMCFIFFLVGLFFWPLCLMLFIWTYRMEEV